MGIFPVYVFDGKPPNMKILHCIPGSSQTCKQNFSFTANILKKFPEKRTQRSNSLIFSFTGRPKIVHEHDTAKHFDLTF